MATKIRQQYAELFQRFRNARSHKEKEEIFEELGKFVAKHPKECEKAFEGGIDDLQKRANALLVKQELNKIIKLVSMKNIAETYFNKSAAWLSQRLNGSKVGENVVYLPDEDIKTLENAVRDIGRQYSEFAFKIS